MGVEALGFDQGGAVESEAALTARPRRLSENTLMPSRLLAFGRGENPDFAVGENAVDVEENEFNFAGASGGGWFRHRRNSSRGRPARVGTRRTAGLPGPPTRVLGRLRSLRPGASRRTFCEYLFSGYNHFHAVRSLPFPCLGSSAGAGVVHGALLDADRTAGARLAAHPRRTYHADLGSD